MSKEQLTMSNEQNELTTEEEIRYLTKTPWLIFLEKLGKRFFLFAFAPLREVLLREAKRDREQGENEKREQ